MRKQKPENSTPDVEAVPLIAGNEDGEAIRDLREPTPLGFSSLAYSKIKTYINFYFHFIISIKVSSFQISHINNY